VSLLVTSIGDVDEVSGGDIGVLGGIFAPVLALYGLADLVIDGCRLRLFAIRGRLLLEV